MPCVNATASDSSNSNGSYNDQYIPSTDYNRDDNFSGNCADFARTIRIGGYLVYIVKLLIPIIIIVKASMSFVSVVTNGKPDELKKKASKLVNALIAGILIFFIPTIVNVVFGFISSFNDNITEDSKICNACIFDPFSSDCREYAERRN